MWVAHDDGLWSSAWEKQGSTGSVSFVWTTGYNQENSPRLDLGVFCCLRRKGVVREGGDWPKCRLLYDIMANATRRGVEAGISLMEGPSQTLQNSVTRSLALNRSLLIRC